MRPKAWNYYQDFLSWDIEKQTKELRTKPAIFWENMGAQKTLEVFHAAAERVPAYKKFLAESGVDHHTIKTIHDFQNVPPIDKKNYLKAYPLNELCWDGDLTKYNVVSVSSGSTGQPFFWPRDLWQEKEVDHLYELTMRELFHGHERHSLVIIAFAIGMYIAGPFTFASLLRIGQKGYPLSITTPSNDIAAVLRVVQNLGNNFDQVIIGGYPPLVKDIVDAGVRESIDWATYNTKLFFGGEGFSERWRDYVHDRLGAKSDLSTTVNMYGTADAALLGIESPVSTGFRRVVTRSKHLIRDVFKSERLPSIVTYNPLMKYFETLSDGALVLTSSSAIPLVRYRIGDVGGMIGYDKIVSTMAGAGHPLETVLRSAKTAHTNWQLPIVYLFGRDDFTVQLYGANVYPENIKEALEDQRIAGLVSGKFVLSIKFRRNMSPVLDLKLELSSGIKPEQAMISLIKQVVVETLRMRNSEYEVIYNTIKRRAEPKIILYTFGHKDFKINIKHSWVDTLKR